MVKNTKTCISWEQNIIFLRNQKILNLCLRWHILRSYCFVAEVAFKDEVSAFIPRFSKYKPNLWLTCWIQSSKSWNTFPELYVHNYVLVNWIVYSKKCSTSCSDILGINRTSKIVGIIKNTKNWISQEWTMTFHDIKNFSNSAL